MTVLPNVSADLSTTDSQHRLWRTPTATLLRVVWENDRSLVGFQHLLNQNTVLYDNFDFAGRNVDIYSPMRIFPKCDIFMNVADKLMKNAETPKEAKLIDLN